MANEPASRDFDELKRLLLSAEVWYRRYISGRSTADLELEISERMAEPTAIASAG